MGLAEDDVETLRDVVPHPGDAMNDPASYVDILDSDYCSFDSIMERRQHFFASMLRLRELERQLSRQSEEEFERRQASEPVAVREKREDRERILKLLVLRALESPDPTETEKLWQEVDRMLD